ncbi:Uncharacterised protein [Streptococcus pneumoniae]|nr:Uncharacterised protein [Streptococcus pneumoniae]
MRFTHSFFCFATLHLQPQNIASSICNLKTVSFVSSICTLKAVLFLIYENLFKPRQLKTVF